MTRRGGVLLCVGPGAAEESHAGIVSPKLVGDSARLGAVIAGYADDLRAAIPARPAGCVMAGKRLNDPSRGERRERERIAA